MVLREQRPVHVHPFPLLGIIVIVVVQPQCLTGLHSALDLVSPVMTRDVRLKVVLDLRQLLIKLRLDHLLGLLHQDPLDPLEGIAVPSR